MKFLEGPAPCGCSSMRTERPTLYQSLAKLERLGLTPSCIVDVGAGADTGALRLAYPEVHHFLFEPDTSLLGDLADNYRNVPHTIYPVAVGDPSLDELLADEDVSGCLLKIDVDGPEIDVLEGSRSVLRNTKILLIEATIQHLTDRAAWLQYAGFDIFDAVDLTYYDGHLWQMDLICLPRQLARNAPVYPFAETKVADASRWATLGY